MSSEQQVPRRRNRATYESEPEQSTSNAVPSQTPQRPAAAAQRDRAHGRVSPLRGLEAMQRKQCYICYEESTSAEQDRRRPFVHACACTLVAHHDCLLEWVTTFQQNHSTAPACPVCGTPYVIREKRSRILQLYKRIATEWEQLAIALIGVESVFSVGYLSALYGAWAVKQWAGDQVGKALFEKKWSLFHWINLPIIPVTLIMSRTALFDSILPFLPLTIVLEMTNPALAPPPPVHTTAGAQAGLDSLSLSYPPSPILTLCLLPWLRILYFRLREKVYEFFLGPQAHLTGIAGFFADMEAAQIRAPVGPQIQADVEVQFAVDVDRRQANQNDNNHQQQQQRHQQQQQQQQQQAPRQAEAERRRIAAEGTLRVGLGRFASFFLGALIFPWLASTAGSGLLWLARRKGMGLLRRILGLSPPKRLWSASAPQSWLSPLFGTRWPGASQERIDPAWIRNTFGAGIVLIIRDAFKISASLLEQRRKASRRVVGRPFGDGLELDSGNTTAAATNNDDERIMSGGRNANGREAVVNTLL